MKKISLVLMMFVGSIMQQEAVSGGMEQPLAFVMIGEINQTNQNVTQIYECDDLKRPCKYDKSLWTQHPVAGMVLPISVVAPDSNQAWECPSDCKEWFVSHYPNTITWFAMPGQQVTVRTSTESGSIVEVSLLVNLHGLLSASCKINASGI
ncbi:MAG: hypothetical protein LBJ92_02310 [Holosporales bacterium]|jgi:hypothetical protein|nr:hypothetical protein [Holosporales bacterium]